jgi:hypothetical protein
MIEFARIAVNGVTGKLSIGRGWAQHRHLGGTTTWSLEATSVGKLSLARPGWRKITVQLRSGELLVIRVPKKRVELLLAELGRGRDERPLPGPTGGVLRLL